MTLACTLSSNIASGREGGDTREGHGHQCFMASEMTSIWSGASGVKDRHQRLGRDLCGSL